MIVVSFNFVLGIGSVLAAAIFNVLNIDPVINAVISLDQCRNPVTLVVNLIYYLIFVTYSYYTLYFRNNNIVQLSISLCNMDELNISFNFSGD